MTAMSRICSWQVPAPLLAGVAVALLAFAGAAAGADADVESLDSLVVTATRSSARAFDLPASVDVIDARTLHEGQPQVSLSETLSRVPGVFAANRQNYAQDLQISSRGFGARAAFGVRGVRLYQDGIPVTMPDGQGQTGSFSLLAAQRMEVLRGPFSTLYGNASGGVIAVFTEEPQDPPLLTLNGGGGSYGTYTASAKLSVRSGAAGAVAAASHFETDGYRDHSAAQRQVANAKLVLMPNSGTRITLIGNSQYQPETQDPLGLTRAQWSDNPRGVDPAALQFDTRKTINQSQGGIALQQQLGDTATLDVTGYGGRRLIRQYLALSGIGATSSGGVADLNRDFGGIGARLTWRTRVLGGPLAIVAGADTDRQHERRRGFVNQNGDLGDLRRDEDDIVRSADGYAEVQWSPWPAWSFTGGVRSSVVRYSSRDHYVTAQNPDDSGARTFRDTSPVLGAVWHVTGSVNAYASYGEGFETPTFAELAYRSGGTGLNFALDPARSRAAEVGVKALIGSRQRVTLAGFVVRTRNEIVIDAATGGRTTFKNAGHTRREGIEAQWDTDLPYDLRAHVAYTWLRAEFSDAFTTGVPPVTVASGARLPGVPAQQAYGELAWSPARAGGFGAAVELQYIDRLYVNERNTDAAPGYMVAHARVGLERKVGAATWRGFVRVNNLLDRTYAGSVIVGDSNGRFFEPAPGRNWFAGINVDVAL
jgi:iron complex outermembrane receptor protein